VAAVVDLLGQLAQAGDGVLLVIKISQRHRDDAAQELLLLDLMLLAAVNMSFVIGCCGLKGVIMLSREPTLEVD
jgi:hypothetical protein